MEKTIILEDREPPSTPDVEKDIKWLCKSLGFVSGRDRHETSVKIFKNIIRKIANEQEICTKELAKEMEVSRGTVNHHLRNFITSGFFTRDRRSIRMRSTSMKKTLEEIHRDVDRIFEDMEKIAQEIDEEMGFQNR